MNGRGQVSGPHHAPTILLTAVTGIMAYSGYQNPFITGNAFIDATAMGLYGLIASVIVLLGMAVVVDGCIRGGLWILERYFSWRETQ